MVRAAFARDGIDVRGVFPDPAGTSRSVNIMGRNGSRKNFFDGRGHMGFAPPLAQCAPVFDGARLVHLNLADYGRRLLDPIRGSGATVACDLQDVVDPADPYRADFVAASDILFCSAANNLSPDVLAADLLARRPAGIVVIGLGADGCAVADAHGLRRYPIPPSGLPVVDTNGAGDSLAVGFLTAFVLDGLGVEEAVQRGQAAARWCCAQRASTDTLWRG